MLRMYLMLPPTDPTVTLEIDAPDGATITMFVPQTVHGSIPNAFLFIGRAISVSRTT